MRKDLSIAAVIVIIIISLGAYAYIDIELVKKFINYPTNRPITSVDWYQPQALVKGSAFPPFQEASKSDAFPKLSSYLEGEDSRAFLLWHKGQLLMESYWQGFSADDRMNVMSLFKPLIFLMVSRAIADSVLPDDQEFAWRYIQPWFNDERRHIRLEHLISFRSGLRFSSDMKDLWSDRNRLHFSEDLEKFVSNAKLRRFPGDEWDPHDLNFQTLALIVEKATRMPLAQYLSESFWKPMGAEDAALWNDRNGYTHGYCCLLTNGRNMLRLGLLLLNKGFYHHQIIAKKWVDRYWEAFQRPPFAAVDIKGLAPESLILAGEGNQRIYILPSKMLVAVRLGEKSDSWDDSRFLDLLTAAIVDQRSAAH